MTSIPSSSLWKEAGKAALDYLKIFSGSFVSSRLFTELVLHCSSERVQGRLFSSLPWE
jgi:hypothetical protein